MKKVSIFISLVLWISALPANSVSAQKKQFDQSQLLEYITKEDMAKHDFYQNSWSSSYPKLQPERFRRRMKMLFAVDIKDYPENAWIPIISDRNTIEDEYFRGEYISIESQKFYSLARVVETIDEKDEGRSPFYGSEYNVGDDYGTLILDYFLYNDLNAFDSMTTYQYRLIKESLGEKWKDDEWAEELLSIYDIPHKVYSFIHTVKPELIYYVDKYKDATNASRSIRTDYEVSIFYRASALRGDLQYLYIMNEENRNRHVTSDADEQDDIAINTNPTIVGFFHNFNNHYPWKENTRLQSITEYFSFLVRLQQKEFNKFVIQYMSGQFETYEAKEVASGYREQIRTNNYFGHAVLREFCENPEREMPTLEKVGTSFNATVVNPKTLLYLEPYSDSYDIDTMQPAEVFKVYEMGYDDYFFVEVTKPVESPVAGPDGYAMILDRTETVYGYIWKKDVKEVSEMEIASQRIKAQAGKPKHGIIDDPDGYVNIRKESNADSEIISKIVDKELFFYWEIAGSDWWYVETRDNMHGFVHKSRICEKIGAGNWILDE